MNAYNHETSALAVPGAPRAKILVIRFKHVGDVVLTSVLCNTLKQTFPKARVDFLIQDTSADLFSNHPYIDRVIALSPTQRKNPLKYWRAIRKLTSERYDLVVDAQSTLQSELVSLLARKHAICIGRKKCHQGFFFTHTVTTMPLLGNKVEEWLKLLTPLQNMGFDIRRHDQMLVNVEPSQRERYREQMLRKGIDFNRPVFAFSVTAKLDAEKWRMDYLEQVVTYCENSFNAQIILNGGSDEESEEVRAFAKRLGGKADLYYDFDLTNLMDLAALWSNCDVYIGHEGGPRYIAHAVGLPSVSIFSPSTRKSEWLPKNSRQHQGVEWEDLDDRPAEEKSHIANALRVGSEKYKELYNKITPQPVIDLIDDVTDFAGIQRVD